MTQLSLIEPNLWRQDTQDGPAQMKGNGSYKQSLEAGAPVVEVNLEGSFVLPSRSGVGKTYIW